MPPESNQISSTTRTGPKQEEECKEANKSGMTAMLDNYATTESDSDEVSGDKEERSALLRKASSSFVSSAYSCSLNIRWPGFI